MTSWLRLAAYGAAAAALWSCGSDQDAGAGGGLGEGGAGGETAGVAVVFDVGGPLTLAPGQSVELVVRAAPPGVYPVAFQILGTALDASLDRSDATTAADGTASLILQAPGKAAEFAVRAVIDTGPGAELAVRVSEIGSGTIRVVPTYGGVRPVEEWTAAVVAQATCAELAANAPGLPEDGFTGSASPDEVLLVEGAPVGPTLAVVARSAEKAWGCATAVLQTPGEELEVEVSVLDRPLELGGIDLAVTLDLPPVDPGVTGILALAAERLVDRAFPEGDAPAAVLLDAMALRLPPEIVGDFDAARLDGDLDAAVAADLGDRGVEPRAVLGTLLVNGQLTFGGAIEGNLRATPGSGAHAVFSLDRFADIEAERVGAPTDHLVSFVANPGDTVVLGGALLFLPSRLAGALAEDAALAAHPDAAMMGDVLADLVGCADVAAVVGTLGDCDLACGEASCLLALGDVWSHSLDASASAGDLGVLTLAVSGLGEADDRAALVGFDGEWVGVLAGEGLEADVAGPAHAEEVAEEGPEEAPRRGGSGP